MKNLTLSDVRRRGCFFTLYPVAREMGIDETAALALLDKLYDKGLKPFPEDDCGMIQADLSTVFFPKKLDTEDIGANMEDFVNNGLIDAKTLSLTDKAWDLLRGAAKEQNKLDDEGFHYCPCSMFH